MHKAPRKHTGSHEYTFYKRRMSQMSQLVIHARGLQQLRYLEKAENFNCSPNLLNSRVAKKRREVSCSQHAAALPHRGDNSVMNITDLLLCYKK